jgi:hypothetical protein
MAIHIMARPGRHRLCRQFLFHFLREGITVAAQALIDAPPHDRREHPQQDHGIHARQFAVDELVGGKGRHGDQNRDFLFDHLGLHGDRTDQRGDAEDQRDVGDIRAVGVAQRQTRIALRCGNRGDHHLRCRGAEADDHHADQQRRHGKETGGGGGAVDELVGAPDQQAETGNDSEKSEQHGFKSS